MARNVFISFRFNDGEYYKDELSKLFELDDDFIDYSENEDRSNMSDTTIKEYLYAKLKKTSITIVILTPNSITYRKNSLTNRYDDWLYDELRYSLEDREENRTNGIVAVYTEEAKDMLLEKTTHICNICNKKSEVRRIKDFDNLVRRNVTNIKEGYKKSKCDNLYDMLEDSYISLISYEDFTSDINKYIENAASKRDRRDEFNLVKELN